MPRAGGGEAEVLTRAVVALSAATGLEEITRVVTDAVRRLTGADGATFVLREDDRCYYVDEDAIGPLWKGGRFPMSACISGWAMLNGRTAIVPDIYADERIPVEAYRPTFVRSLAMAPIRASSPVGALGAYWADGGVPDRAAVRTLETLANSAAIGLENLQLRGEVARRSAERDDLETALHSVIHDLRSPLFAMMGYAELVAEMTTDPQIARFAEVIRASGERAGTQIDQLLALYRITHGTSNPAPVDLTAMAHRVADELRAGEPQRTVSVSIDDGLVAIADPALAEILVRNLVGNAFKYTTRQAEPHVHVGRSEGTGTQMQFFVRDNGIGFLQADAGKLFQPLGRLPSARDFAGTGLGLASVARIVELHGGTVSAEGNLGLGATFYFTLAAAA